MAGGAGVQRSHVPKFGNWDSDNVPYTVYFENARKEKTTGVRMNPNDPKENPEAFMFREEGSKSNGVSRAAQVPLQSGSDKLTSAEKRRVEGHKKQSGHWRNTSDQLKTGSRKSMTSESGSDKSNSDHSLLHQNHRAMRPDRKKSVIEAHGSIVPSPLGPDRLRSGMNPPVENTRRSAAVPKFGAWDESDPKSGEGFTFIFNKVKEEKQIAAAKDVAACSKVEATDSCGSALA
ncbi:RPM1-interacting protein 4-like [Cornus florida]|uniref:RPM1-interacting protein 4-like n=1 Tax=Cornus florida TaxID=4283 RepID=UPI00289A4754|nr:RPM1-interacting protein 4-like [Cornus florida]